MRGFLPRRITRTIPRDTAGTPPMAELDSPATTLANWLSSITTTRHASPALLFTLYDSRPFAHVWYSARSAGETTRAFALERLYTHRARAGGPHPDPRMQSVFSRLAVAAMAARGMGIRVKPLKSSPPVATPSQPQPSTHGPMAWLITYEERRPELLVRHTEHRGALAFEMGVLLAYFARTEDRLMDPDAPRGLVMPANDPAMETILHQWVIGLLCLPLDCPAEWTCHCNAIRRRFNEPPSDHLQPTDALMAAAIHDYLSRGSPEQSQQGSQP